MCAGAVPGDVRAVGRGVRPRVGGRTGMLMYIFLIKNNNKYNQVVLRVFFYTLHRWLVIDFFLHTSYLRKLVATEISSHR